jgi:DNA-binding CsgD family transcriptional regulator
LKPGGRRNRKSLWRARSLKPKVSTPPLPRHGIVIVSASGRIQFATRQAWPLLIEYLGLARGTQKLPPDLRHWACSSPKVPRRWCRPGRYVEAHVLDHTRKGTQFLFLIESHAGRIELTERPAEIKWLVFLGKRNAEIAEELHLRTATVKKQIHVMMDKIGVDTRIGVALYDLPIPPSLDPTLRG